MGNVSVAALLGRLVISFGIVVVLMAVLAKVARRRLGRGGMRGGRKDGLQLQVLSRQAIGKNVSVLLVRAGDRALLLGVTESSVSLLRETELPSECEPAPAASPSAIVTPARGGLLQRAREVTVRRV